MLFKTKHTNAMRRLIYSSIIILPALLTSTIHKALDTQLIMNTKLSNLTALGSSIYLNLQSSESTLQYSLSQLSSTKEFQSLDKLGIAEQVNNFLYYNKNISNLYILDHNKTNIFGINNNQLSQSIHTNHVDSALRGIPSNEDRFT